MLVQCTQPLGSIIFCIKISACALFCCNLLAKVNTQLFIYKDPTFSTSIMYFHSPFVHKFGTTLTFLKNTFQLEFFSKIWIKDRMLQDKLKTAKKKKKKENYFYDFKVAIIQIFTSCLNFYWRFFNKIWASYAPKCSVKSYL